MQRRPVHRRSVRPRLAAVLAVAALSACRCETQDLAGLDASIGGRLCHPTSGAAEPGITVSIAPSRGAVVEAVTDEDGAFLVRGLPDGPALVVARSAVGERRFDVDLARGDTTTLVDEACRDRPFPPGHGEITGTICDRHTGDVIDDATVSIALPDGDLEAETDASGTFLLFPVPVGEHVVRAIADGYQRSWLVVVEEGGTTEIPAGAGCAPPTADQGLVRGALCDPGSDGPLAGADVVAVDAAGDEHRDLTDVDGMFLVGPMATGVARIRVTRAPELELDLVAVVVAGETRDVTNGGDCGLETCTTIEVGGADVEPPRILLVVDRSGSMAQSAPGYGTTRWRTVRDAVVTLVQGVGEDAQFGLMLYPAVGGDSCTTGALAVPLGTGVVAQVASTLDDFYTSPNGGTPTSATLRAAADLLAGLPEPERIAVILATDGGPNCNAANDASTCVCSGAPEDCDPTFGADADLMCLDHHAAVDAAAELKAMGVATYVVGIPGAEAFGWVLDEIAIAGGTAGPGARKYYPADDTATLAESLETISRRILSCRLDVDVEGGVDAASRVAVRIDGDEIPRDPSHVDGFDVVGARTVELYGAACEAALDSDAPVVVDVCRVDADQEVAP